MYAFPDRYRHACMNGIMTRAWDYLSNPLQSARRGQLVILATIALLSTTLIALPACAETLTVSPARPQVNDDVYLNYEGVLAGIDIVVDAVETQIVGNTIVLTISARSTDQLLRASVYRGTIALGRLPTGHYTVNYFTRDFTGFPPNILTYGPPKLAVTTTFDVAAVSALPIPAFSRAWYMMAVIIIFLMAVMHFRRVARP